MHTLGNGQGSVRERGFRDVSVCRIQRKAETERRPNVTRDMAVPADWLFRLHGAHTAR